MSPLHPNLGHFGRPPIAHYYSNHSHTHNSNHLEPLEKIESPQLASLALGANKQINIRNTNQLSWAINYTYWQLTVEQNCINSLNATNHLVKLFIWKVTSSYTVERSCTNVPNAANHLVFLLLWGITLSAILAKRCTNVPNATSLLVLNMFWGTTLRLTLERSQLVSTLKKPSNSKSMMSFVKLLPSCASPI